MRHPYRQSTAYAIERLNQVKRQQTLHPDRMVIATTPQEIRTIKAQGKKAICLGIENGYALGKLVETYECSRRWEFLISPYAIMGITIFVIPLEENRNGKD